MDVLGRAGVVYDALTLRDPGVRASDMREGVAEARHSASRDAARCNGGIGLGESCSPFPFAIDLVVPIESVRRRGIAEGLSVSRTLMD